MHAHNVAFKFSLSLLISKRSINMLLFFHESNRNRRTSNFAKCKRGKKWQQQCQTAAGRVCESGCGIWWAMYLVQLSFSTPRSDSIKSISGCNKIPVDSLWVLLLTQAEAFNQRHSHGGITVNSSVFCWDAWFPIAKTNICYPRLAWYPAMPNTDNNQTTWFPVISIQFWISPRACKKACAPWELGRSVLHLGRK